MKLDIEQSILKFENTNNIKVNKYYSNSANYNGDNLPDKYIGEDILFNNIQEWLEICEDEEEKKCVLELFEQYMYFPYDKFQREVIKIIGKLKSEGVDINNTFFIVFSSSKGVASGGDSISSALTLAIMNDSVKENIITDTEKATDILKQNIQNYKYIVFCDDVIGSGYTLNTKIKHFFDRFNIASGTTIYISLICGRKKKIIEKIKEFNKELGKKYNVCFKYILLNPIKKCLDESSIEEINKNKIKKIEERVEEYAIEDKDKTYFCGFNENQLLVSFFYNTPNNTLSLFWRPTIISVPLFQRTSYKRLTIDDCRKNKERLSNNAYIKGTIK